MQVGNLGPTHNDTQIQLLKKLNALRSYDKMFKLGYIYY